uniref:Uncharacterized protein n=1 Tax=Panagrolaimus sp. JU765 TaxID=591449 RepID=A0AC34Q5J9_9BILA
MQVVTRCPATAISSSRMRAAAFLLFLALVVVASSSRMCGPRLQNMVTKTCTFGQEQKPCIDTSKMKDDFLQRCCQHGCELKEIQKVCCFTDSCLAECYPGKNYKMGQVY